MSEIVVVITGATGPSGGGGGGGASALDDLTDVTITAAAAGDILRHNGTAWVDAVGTTHFEAAGAVAAHEADTTNVHGIADTSALETTTGSASKVSTHAALTSSVHGISAFGATLVDDADAATARTTLGLAIGTNVAAQSSLANYLPLVAAGASVENVGAVEANVNTVATTGSTETLDTSVYQVHDCTMDQNCTFTFSNPAPSGKCSSFVLILRGAFTPTLPASVDWSGGAAPTYTTPSMYTFTTVDAGTTWLGAQVGKAFA
jgi:hypothetical protein